MGAKEMRGGIVWDGFARSGGVWFDSGAICLILELRVRICGRLGASDTVIDSRGELLGSSY